MLIASVDAGLGTRVYSGSCDEPACIGEDYLTQTFDVEANVEYKFLVSRQGFDLGSSFYISVDVQEASPFPTDEGTPFPTECTVQMPIPPNLTITSNAQAYRVLRAHRQSQVFLQRLRCGIIRPYLPLPLVQSCR